MKSTKTPTKKRNRNRNHHHHLPLIFLIITVVVVVLLLPLISLLFLLLPKYFYIIRSSSSSKTFFNLPKHFYNYELRTLHTYHFKNSSLYRYNGRKYEIIMNNNNNRNKNIFSDMMIVNHEEQQEQENYFVVLTLDEEEEMKKYKVSCSGRCNCYIDDDDYVNDDRRILNYYNNNNNIIRRNAGLMVYTYKYSSIVIVGSIITLALSKFVDEHIEDCYDSMMKRENNIIDFTSNRRPPVTCIMEDVDCDEEEAVQEGGSSSSTIDDDVERYYLCKGHCLTRNLRNEQALEAAKTFECEQQWAKSTVIATSFSRCGGTREDKLRDESVEDAKRRYQKAILEPHCAALQTYYDKETPIRVRTRKPYVKKYFFPCVGSKPRFRSLENVECEYVFET